MSTRKPSLYRLLRYLLRVLRSRTRDLRCPCQIFVNAYTEYLGLTWRFTWQVSADMLFGTCRISQRVFVEGLFLILRWVVKVYGKRGI